MAEYASGVPMWVDVSSPDIEKSRAFYRDLFDWTDQVVPDPGAGGYTMFFKDGKMVAAAGPTFSPDQHPAWSTYVCTDDAEVTAAAAKDAGGEVVAPPVDVMGQGSMAVLKDPTGAYISLWQPKIHRGAEIVNEPGSFSWNELYTRDVPTATEFYGNLFGWGTEQTEMSFGAYTLFQVDGRSIAGGIDMSGMLPDSIPPHWLVYFSVEDADATVGRAKDLGGTINYGPQSTPMGPMAVISDPVGAVFAVIQFTPES